MRLPRPTSPTAPWAGATLLALAMVAACEQRVIFERQGYDAGGGTTGSGGNGGKGGTGGPGMCPTGQSPFLDVHPDLSNVIIALDRSTSMNGSFGPSSKLDTARALLTKLVSRYEHSIRFGYVGFPGSACFQDACCPLDASDPIRDGYPRFVADLGACDAPSTCAMGSERSIAAALAASVETYTDRNPQGADYVVLITDGPPECTGNADVCRDSQARVVDLNRLQQGPAKVSVIGLGTQDRCLGNLGSTGNGGFTPVFSPAEFEDDLDWILYNIADDACRLTIDIPPTDPDKVTIVYNDVVTIPRDHDRLNGWEFDNQNQFRIRIYGDACEMIVRGGDPELLDVIENCRPPKQ